MAWGFLEYKDAYESTRQTHFLKEALKWGADYFLKAHTSPNVLVGQVCIYAYTALTVAVV